MTRLQPISTLFPYTTPLPIFSNEKGNFDYLMFADIDHKNPDVKAELFRWGEWFVNYVNVDRKSTRLNSSHLGISYAVFCLKKKKRDELMIHRNDTDITDP